MINDKVVVLCWKCGELLNDHFT